MKKADNPKYQMRVQAKEQAGVLVPKAKSTTVEIATPLTPPEKQRLVELERVVDAKLGDFFEVASALMEIKSKELFRETHRNFHLYCQEHWGFGRSYANKLIGSAERIKLLPPALPKPANEFTMRPFLKLEPEEFPERWKAVLKEAGEKPVTSTIVKETLHLPKRKRKRRRVKTADQQEKIDGLLVSLRAALEKKNVDDAMQELANLEKVLRV
jgi:hypothetical protein